MGFMDYIQDKQPLDWKPDEDFKVIWIERDVQVHTPNKGPQPLFIIYAIVNFTPPHHSHGDIEPVEIHKTWPVTQFDESYLKSPALAGPSGNLDRKSSLEWAWREFNSKHNHFHLLSKDIQNHIESICEEKAFDSLETTSPEKWEP